MRIDHLAFRVKDRHTTANFFKEAMGYRPCSRVPEGFRVDFDDGTYALCTVLVPGERPDATGTLPRLSWNTFVPIPDHPDILQEYHQPPEVFISEGSPGSIVDRWVKTNGNRLHHIALQVENITETLQHWQEKGYASFASDEILECPGLKQIFTNPSDLTGCIWELIERDPKDNGFCVDNVRNLMLSTDAKQT